MKSLARSENEKRFRNRDYRYASTVSIYRIVCTSENKSLVGTAVPAHISASYGAYQMTADASTIVISRWGNSDGVISVLYGIRMMMPNEIRACNERCSCFPTIIQFDIRTVTCFIAYQIRHLCMKRIVKIFARQTKPNEVIIKQKKKLHGLSPRANYTDRATAACRRSDCQLLRIKGATWSTWRISTAVFSVL
jgi:hypothetical protein